MGITNLWPQKSECLNLVETTRKSVSLSDRLSSFPPQPDYGEARRASNRKEILKLTIPSSKDCIGADQAWFRPRH